MFLWIKCYLCGRKLSVKLGDFISNESVTTSEVPQGSHLGPLLFLIFINNVGASLFTSKFLLYADDMKIYIKLNSVRDCELLQQDLNRFSEWCQ